jgi:hypothetical protein
MTHNLYLGAIVLFRVLSVLTLLWGTFLGLLSLPFQFNPGATTPLLTPWASLIPALAALALWFLARPIARVVTSGLDR